MKNIKIGSIVADFYNDNVYYFIVTYFKDDFEDDDTVAGLSFLGVTGEIDRLGYTFRVRTWERLETIEGFWKLVSP